MPLSYEEEKEREETKVRWEKQDKVFPKAILLGCLCWSLCFPMALILRIRIRMPLWYAIEMDLIGDD